MRALLPLIACCLLAAAEPPAPAETATAAARRAAEVITAQHGFFTWALGGAWRRAGGAADAPEARFLDHLAEHLASDGRLPTPDAMRAEARALLASGTKDPLARLRCAILLNDVAMAGSCSADLRSRQGAQAYPALHLVSALYRQLRSRDRAAADQARTELPGAAAAAAAEALAAAPVPRAVTIDRLVDWMQRLFEQGGLDAAGRARTLELLARPDGDPALTRTLAGAAAIADAWRARGSGWANTVSEEGWKGFRAGLATARRELTAAWEELPAASSAAALMITVAMGDGGGDSGTWFARALAADPGCEEAWGRMGTATLPRWGGSTARLLALARRAAALAAPGNNLDRRCEGALSSYLSEGGNEAAAWTVVAQLDAIRPPADEGARRLRALGAAWHAGRRDQAMALFTDLGGLAAPAEAVAAAPFNPPLGGRLLLLHIERARLGLAEDGPQPIPASGDGLCRAQHAPGMATLLPAWWRQHGRPDPAWDARIGGLLERRAAGPATGAHELVAAGCSDPLVRYLACTERDAADRRSALAASWDALEKAGYPPLAVWQPAWYLMQALHRDPAAAEREGLQARFATLAAALAASAGSAGVTPGMVVAELGDPPGNDPSLLALIERAAQADGIDRTVADGVAGRIALARACRASPNSAERSRLAWTAMARLMPAWAACHHPCIAGDLATAACLAGLPSVEARRWFDLGVRKGWDDGAAWKGLSEGFALTGRPDDLLAFAEEIAALPASAGLAARALDPALSVIANRYLHSKERVKKAWSAGGAATAALLADPALAPDRRTHWLHVRLGLAALAGEKAAAEQAARQLGAAYDPKRLPAGIDAAKVEPFTSAAEAAEKTTF